MSDDIIEREVLGEVSDACRVLIERVRTRLGREQAGSAIELTQYASLAFEAYSETLLRALLAAASRRSADDGDVWVRRQFRDGLESVGTALRAAVEQCAHRHAIAQGLQQKMFEAELLLRRALRGRAVQPAGAMEITPVHTKVAG